MDEFKGHDDTVQLWIALQWQEIYLHSSMIPLHKSLCICICSDPNISKLVLWFMFCSLLHDGRDTDRMFSHWNENVIKTQFNDRMPPIYTQCSKIKTSLNACFDKILLIISKSYLHNWLPVNSILFNVEYNRNSWVWISLCW
jgi:hypothetical protein